MRPERREQRHRLVRLTAAGWAAVRAQPWDATQADCLGHWARHDLPLVVTRQRAGDGEGEGEGVALGLPAPLAWGRCRVALRVDRASIAGFDDFPPLADVLARAAQPVSPAWQALAGALQAAGVTARVHGSHGWQHLSGLPCTRPGSDLDLLLPVASTAQAQAAVAALRRAEAVGPAVRLDGELILPDGAGVSWREWADWRAGRVREVLVKRLDGVALQDTLPLADEAAARIGRRVTRALYDEVALWPKPGLVSFRDNGSHDDMDARTFLRSLFALRRAFPAFVALGQRRAPFAALERAGIAAEARMLAATGGINTHRGAIFTLGLLCAAAGRLLPAEASAVPSFDAAALRQSLHAGWGAALQARAHRTATADSHGARAASHHGLRGAGAEAAAGFPVLFEVALPALRGALRRGLPMAAARLEAFFAVMAVLDDTNLVHRGGLDGLHFARQGARAFLAAGGAARPDAIDHAQALHRDFVARRLSPGGSADVLAAACWLHAVCAPDAG